MTSYKAPLRDMQFILHDLLKVSEQDIPGFAELDRDFTQAVLEEAGKVASDILLPLNAVRLLGIGHPGANQHTKNHQRLPSKKLHHTPPEHFIFDPLHDQDRSRKSR